MNRWLIPVVLVLLGAPAARAEITNTQQAVLDSLAAWHHQSRPDRVDTLAATAIPRARVSGQDDYLLQLLLHAGRTRAAFGMARQAEPDLAEACGLAAAAGDTATWLRSLRWLSVAVGRQGRTAEATGHYRRLQEMAAAAGDSTHLGWALLGLAYDHYLNSRSASADSCYGEAAGILARLGIDRGALWAFNGQGLARRQAGDFPGAARSFGRCLELAEQQGDELNQAMALNYLGRLDLLLGDPGRAVARFRQAAAIHGRLHHHREGLLPWLDIAQARIMQGRLREAAAHLDSVRIEAGSHGLADLQLLAVGLLADVRLSEGRPAAAARLCRQALTRGEFPSAMAETELRLGLARALAGRDSLAEAVAVLERTGPDGGPGAAVLQLRSARLMADCLLALEDPARAQAIARQAVAEARRTGADGLLMSLLTVAARASLACGQADSALALVTRATRRWEADRTVPADPKWRELRSEASSELFCLGARLLARDDAAAAFDFVQRYKARTLLERMAGPGKSELAPLLPASLEPLQREILQPGQVLLDVVNHRNRTVFFLVTSDTLLVDVPSDTRTLAGRQRRLSDVLVARQVDDPGLAPLLARNLWRPGPAVTGRLAGATELIWCPDGLWHDVPLGLWRGEGGLLSAACTVTRIPAAAVLTAHDDGQRQAGGHGEILAVAGPGPDGQILPGAAAEVGWLAHRFARVRRPDPASAGADPAQALRTEGILHLAVHAEIPAQQPWAASLALAPGVRVQAEQVAGMQLPARLAVLASCRSAGSHILHGEGMLGLTSGFLAAGVPSVLATLWPVDDRATALFMQDFYLGLEQGRSAARALRQAQDRRREDPRTAAARHWAGFVLVGDAHPAVAPSPRSSHLPLAGAGLLAAAALWWRGRRLARDGKSSATL